MQGYGVIVRTVCWDARSTAARLAQSLHVVTVLGDTDAGAAVYVSCLPRNTHLPSPLPVLARHVCKTCRDTALNSAAARIGVAINRRLELL